jgi:hypothetical protein
MSLNFPTLQTHSEDGVLLLPVIMKPHLFSIHASPTAPQDHLFLVDLQLSTADLAD